MTDSLADHPAQPDLATPQEPTPPLSNQQLAANRRNALRSSGPRTAAGKAVARDNALKHGFLSRHLLIEGESAADFQQLLDELMREYRPVGVVEKGLVEQVAICLWRKARFVRAEAAIWSNPFKCLHAPTAKIWRWCKLSTLDSAKVFCLRVAFLQAQLLAR